MSDSYERVMEDRRQLVEKIIDNMKNGYLMPRPSWDHNIFDAHIRNPVSGTMYRGSNFVRLYLAEIDKGYTDSRWVTFKQANSMGWKIKAGEKGIRCEKYIFEKKIKEENPTTGDIEEKTIELSKPMVNSFVVFNAAQIEGIPEEKVVRSDPLQPDAILDMAEIFRLSSACPIRETNEGRAYYLPMKDEIVLPVRDAFLDTQSFLATQLHEMIHSTGHPDRLNRSLSTSFGSEDYAMEELRAELGSFFIQVDLNLHFDAQHFNSHTQYLESWIKTLKEDPNELFRAIADAQKACDFLMKNYERQLKQDRMLDGFSQARKPSKTVDASQEAQKQPEVCFDSFEFEKHIPHNMRFKQYGLVNENEMYWVTYGVFTVEDLREFQQAARDYAGDIKKFYVTSRSLSPSYVFEDDRASRVLATVTTDEILKDDYVKAIEEAGLEEYLIPETEIELTMQEEAAVRMAVKHEIKTPDTGKEYLNGWIEKNIQRRINCGLPDKDRTYDAMWSKFQQLVKNPEQVLQAPVRSCSR